MQVSDSSSRILAGLLEARTGQQLTMNRRWRIETALAGLLRERGIGTLDELITILVMGKEPGRILEVIDVDLPYPRTEEIRLSPQFAQLRADVWRAVYHQPPGEARTRSQSA